MNLMDKWNALGDKVVNKEMEALVKQIGQAIIDGAVYVGHTLTEWMPEIGAGIVVVCAVGIMLSGNAPKWLARMAIGLGAAIIWLTVK
ncbi:hypothetical protein [Neobacillus drentensis]|uniref:hypothetical protein n=1 Tax=Neobacillus drentensis TaxID=220684 RepID=UPI002855A2EB|nr:hypothetical protein [Neobacillus drentensis]MDR7237095.1 hypothetical protein [Neobacillus drentensis]